MKKILIAAAIAATFVTPQAFAQAKNFEGFSVLGAVNFNNNKGEVNTATVPSSVSRTDSNVGLQAEYGLALGDSFVLGLGGTMGLTDINVADNAKLKNAYSVYLAPGFAVSDNTLLYAKIASISGKFDANFGSTDLSGTGFGFGARFLSGKNVFYQVEYMNNQYQDKDAVSNAAVKYQAKNQTGVLSFGVGYKF